MKRILTVFVITLIVFMSVMTYIMPADARKAQKTKGAFSEKQIEDMQVMINNLTKKIYTRELYTPKDSENLINVKLQLDDQMNISPEPTLAPLYYKAGSLYKMRGLKKEAVGCYQTILENFSDTAYAPKARAELKEMGIEIKEVAPILGTDESDDSE